MRLGSRVETSHATYHPEMHAVICQRRVVQPDDRGCDGFATVRRAGQEGVRAHQVKR